MRKIVALTLLGGLCLGLLGGCVVYEASAADLSRGIVKNDLPADADLTKSGTVNQFALALLKQSLGEEDALVSPLSVLSALALVQNGAEGETLQQLEQTLGLPAGQMNSWLHTYMAGVETGEKNAASLHLANGIWFRDTEALEVRREFLQTNADYLGAAVWKAPFDNSTVKQVNDWVEENTHGMIEEILDQISADSMLLLANALAFEAQWRDIYLDQQIRGGDFTCPDGSKVKAELMYHTGYMPYVELERGSGFLRQYKGGRYAFLGLLPEEGTSVEDFLAGLDGMTLADRVKNAKSLEVRTAIPKFKAEYETDLAQVLQQMGITRAFTPAAQFEPMAHHPDGLYIGRVLHKTFIQVDQQGTKAGAATLVDMKAGSAAPMEKPEPKEVYLDRPFVYAIWDLQANIPVFLGVCTQP